MFNSKNRVESRVVRMFWNDGVLDLLAGCGVILIGIAWVADLVPLGAVAPALLMPFWRPLRAKITEPRLGYVEFSDSQQRRNRTFLAMTIFFGVLTMCSGIAVYAFFMERIPLEKSQVVPALPACIIGFMGLMTAAITSQGRFVVYALALAMCGVLGAVLQLEPGWSLLAGGLVIVIGGTITMTQFIVRYPLPADAK